MATTSVNIRMDEDLKRGMEKTCHELGMNLTTAFTIFAAKVNRERRIPFDVSIDPFFSDRNISHLENKLADYKAGRLPLAEHELIEEQTCREEL